MTSSRKMRKALVTRRTIKPIGVPSPTEVEQFAQGLMAKLNNDLQTQFEDDVEVILGFMTHPTPELRVRGAEAASQIEVAISIAERKARDAQRMRDELVDAFQQPKRRGFLSA